MKEFLEVCLLSYSCGSTVLGTSGPTPRSFAHRSNELSGAGCTAHATPKNTPAVCLLVASQAFMSVRANWQLHCAFFIRDLRTIGYLHSCGGARPRLTNC